MEVAFQTCRNRLIARYLKFLPETIKQSNLFDEFSLCWNELCRAHDKIVATCTESRPNNKILKFKNIISEELKLFLSSSYLKYLTQYATSYAKFAGLVKFEIQTDSILYSALAKPNQIEERNRANNYSAAHYHSKPLGIYKDLNDILLLPFDHVLAVSRHLDEILHYCDADINKKLMYNISRALKHFNSYFPSPTSLKQKLFQKVEKEVLVRTFRRSENVSNEALLDFLWNDQSTPLGKIEKNDILIIFKNKDQQQLHLKHGVLSIFSSGMLIGSMYNKKATNASKLIQSYTIHALLRFNCFEFLWVRDPIISLQNGECMEKLLIRQIDHCNRYNRNDIEQIIVKTRKDSKLSINEMLHNYGNSIESGTIDSI